MKSFLIEVQFAWKVSGVNVSYLLPASFSSIFLFEKVLFLLFVVGLSSQETSMLGGLRIYTLEDLFKIDFFSSNAVYSCEESLFTVESFFLVTSSEVVFY